VLLIDTEKFLNAAADDQAGDQTQSQSKRRGFDAVERAASRLEWLCYSLSAVHAHGNAVFQANLTVVAVQSSTPAQEARDHVSYPSGAFDRHDKFKRRSYRLTVYRK
jgi:hypothetical protein